jgi:hypothetical protein
MLVLGAQVNINHSFGAILVQSWPKPISFLLHLLNFNMYRKPKRQHFFPAHFFVEAWLKKDLIICRSIH